MSSPISNNLALTERSPEPNRSRLGSDRGASRRALRCERGLLHAISLSAIAIVCSSANARAADLNDYPTSARADYVFACMKANGETQDVLQKCSCSIDVLASVIPYDKYVAAETILSMSQVTGPVGAEFRSTESAKATLEDFRRAQAEAEVRCF